MYRVHVILGHPAPACRVEAGRGATMRYYDKFRV